MDLPELNTKPILYSEIESRYQNIRDSESLVKARDVQTANAIKDQAIQDQNRKDADLMGKSTMQFLDAFQQQHKEDATAEIQPATPEGVDASYKKDTSNDQWLDADGLPLNAWEAPAKKPSGAPNMFNKDNVMLQAHLMEKNGVSPANIANYVLQAESNASKFDKANLDVVKLQDDHRKAVNDAQAALTAQGDIITAHRNDQADDIRSSSTPLQSFQLALSQMPKMWAPALQQNGIDPTNMGDLTDPKNPNAQKIQQMLATMQQNSKQYQDREKGTLENRFKQSEIDKNEAAAYKDKQINDIAQNGSPAIDARIERIYNGLELMPPAGSRSKDNESVRARMAIVHPDFDEVNNKNLVAARKDFNAGTPVGQRITGINTFTMHADELESLIKTLPGDDTRALNQVQRWYQKNFGGNPEFSNWEVTSKEVGNEFSRIMVPTGPGSSDERAEVVNLFENVKSKDALEGAIKQARHLVAQKTIAYAKDWQKAGIPDDFYETNLTARTRAVVGATEDKDGWVLHKDKDGNYAYVNPKNPKEYRETQ